MVVSCGIVLLSVVVGLVAFELWLRSEMSGRRDRPLVLAEADIYPYLEIANLFPFQPNGVLQREYGYRKDHLLYQHRKTEHVVSAGDRFERMYRYPSGDAIGECFGVSDFYRWRTVAHGGHPLEATYFSQLQRSLKATYPIQVIAAGIGGGSSQPRRLFCSRSRSCQSSGHGRDPRRVEIVSASVRF